MDSTPSAPARRVDGSAPIRASSAASAGCPGACTSGSAWRPRSRAGTGSDAPSGVARRKRGQEEVVVLIGVLVPAIELAPAVLVASFLARGLGRSPRSLAM